MKMRRRVPSYDKKTKIQCEHNGAGGPWKESRNCFPGKEKGTPTPMLDRK